MYKGLADATLELDFSHAVTAHHARQELEIWASGIVGEELLNFFFFGAEGLDT